MAAAKRRILVVEDDHKTADLVRLYLERDGYWVLTAYDGSEGLDVAREWKPDLVVLDLLLPGFNGMEVCRTLRNESEVPIIMLTALSTEQDKLGGLDLGADDYVTKPFSPKELVARVHAVLRRTIEDSIYSVPSGVERGELKIDFHQHNVKVRERDVHLTPTEFRILAALVREPGRVFSRSQLVDKALGYDFEGMDRTVDVHVLNLRRKIEVDANSPRYVMTVYGMGYKFGG
jgi:DNA-binding response OmpR family regulator